MRNIFLYKNYVKCFGLKIKIDSNICPYKYIINVGWDNRKIDMWHLGAKPKPSQLPAFPVKKQFSATNKYITSPPIDREREKCGYANSVA